MNLGEYIAKYRRGNNALTHAEARIAGIEYPLPAGWVGRYRLLEVDGEAMRAAKLARRQSIKDRGNHETKKEKRARKLGAPPVRTPKITVAVVIELAAESVGSERHAYINSAAFLASFEWRQLRIQVLRHYGAKCMCCGATPASGAVMNVDHIKPRRRFPQLALAFDNLQVLCEDCNHGKANDVVDFRPGAVARAERKT